MSDADFTLPRTNAGPWQSRPFHRQYLMRQANDLFDFFEAASINPKGGFHELSDEGMPVQPDNALRQIHVTTRMIHCAVIGSLLGRPGSDEVVDHGMRYLWEQHRDRKHGGYVWSLDDDGPADDSKQAYGHAFVLLAGASAKLVGHPLADQVIADVTEVIGTRFWDNKAGAVREEFANDWGQISTYRGQNSNMHLTEALMAAYEATGKEDYIQKATRIADLIIRRNAVKLDHRVAEHFHEDWSLDKQFQGSEMFRPSGTTPGHALEWSRLLFQLFVLGRKEHGWMTEAARGLFRNAIELGWDKKHGGFFYTLDWDNQPIMREKLWWPVAEAIGAAAFIGAYDKDAYYQHWYRKLWDFAENHIIDHERGGWISELKDDLTPTARLFVGKPDIYHALQACLIPLYPPSGSLTRAIIEGDRLGPQY
ncbi:AGE family epimerase/isomerase [Devosia sp. YIM 151766]|uniref:AGE family epimerase/isomerase n=1 Tax=Devosia sp. YIM 151766 TaxID=3017325 RepID=UPI00255CD33D|nr:AGE family epimerase/isomerase [Devosia sp. YIM 151766]WIY53754.1 AGE family epimerase/isomerase [Devosia sp. YIM 151766]